MVRKFFSYFCLSYLFWLLLYWPFGVDRIASLQGLLVGVPVAFLITMLFGGVFARQPEKIFQVKRYFWFLYYIPIFVYYCIIANLDVAYRVLSPEMPINPGIVKVKTSLRSRSGLTALANSITLTPGTMSVDLTEDGYIYIHWINVQTQDVEKASELIVRPFEKILRRIFE